MLMIQELQELKNEINEIKESLNQMKKSYKPHEGMENRTIAIEKRLAEQEQYSRRECIEIVGLPQDANGGELEDLVVETFDTAGVQVERRDFHVFTDWKTKRLWLQNSLTVGGKVCKYNQEEKEITAVKR